MNKKVIFPLLLASVFFVLGSCSSDDSDENTPLPTFFKFTMDDTDYDFEFVVTSEGPSRMHIEGENGLALTDPGFAKLVLWSPLDLVEGSYQISPGPFASDGTTPIDTYKIALYENSLNFFNDFATSGTITITGFVNEFVEGTFNGTISNQEGSTVTITNGSFRAVYIR